MQSWRVKSQVQGIYGLKPLDVFPVLRRIADRAYYPDSNRAIDSVYMQVSLNKQAHQYTVDNGVIVLSHSACTMRSPPCCVRGYAG